MWASCGDGHGNIVVVSRCHACTIHDATKDAGQEDPTSSRGKEDEEEASVASHTQGNGRRIRTSRQGPFLARLSSALRGKPVDSLSASWRQTCRNTAAMRGFMGSWYQSGASMDVAGLEPPTMFKAVTALLKHFQSLAAHQPHLLCEHPHADCGRRSAYNTDAGTRHREQRRQKHQLECGCGRPSLYYVCRVQPQRTMLWRDLLSFNESPGNLKEEGSR